MQYLQASRGREPGGGRGAKLAGPSVRLYYWLDPTPGAVPPGGEELPHRQAVDRGPAVISYRRFRNTDPPALAEVWNESLTSRGTYPLQTPALFERWVFSKPYFDHDAGWSRCRSTPPSGSSSRNRDGKLYERLP